MRLIQPTAGGVAMHLTDRQIQQFRDSGYVAGPRVLDDGQIARIKDRIADILERRIPFPEHLVGRAVLRAGQEDRLASVKVVNLFRNDEVFAEVLKSEAIGSLAHDLLEGPVRVWEDQMIFKPPRDSSAVQAWHRDYTYWDHVGPPELATCWIALDDATVQNGCMHVIPGSHKWPTDYGRDEVDIDDPHWVLRPEHVPEGVDLTPVPCEVQAGHCHFHHCLLLHGSHGNSTDNPRRSYILHLMPGNTRRIGDNWNPRHATVDVPLGEIVRGPQYPELAAPVEADERQ